MSVEKFETEHKAFFDETGGKLMQLASTMRGGFTAHDVGGLFVATAIAVLQSCMTRAEIGAWLHKLADGVHDLEERVVN